MILLPLVFLAGTMQPVPVATSPAPRSMPRRVEGDLCDAGEEGWQLVPASFPSATGYDDDAPLSPDEQPLPEDNMGPGGDPGAEEECPMLFVVPFDVWDGELWFDMSAYGPSI
ncbi:MAG TPA: hypothetical protein VMQ93_11960 [Novosphingobium sp.]|nr:hypothetical protein [Novosphingobium sp.]